MPKLSDLSLSDRKVYFPFGWCEVKEGFCEDCCLYGFCDTSFSSPCDWFSDYYKLDSLCVFIRDL